MVAVPTIDNHFILPGRRHGERPFAFMICRALGDQTIGLIFDRYLGVSSRRVIVEIGFELNSAVAKLAFCAEIVCRRRGCGQQKHHDAANRETHRFNAAIGFQLSKIVLVDRKAESSAETTRARPVKPATPTVGIHELVAVAPEVFFNPPFKLGRKGGILLLLLANRTEKRIDLRSIGGGG